MRVFVSWSGQRSQALASAFREWLPLVLHYVEPWMSDADIDAGDRWAQSVATELALSSYGIVCVTSENVNSPWVLFETGALAKSMDTSKVIPVLLDLEFSDISGPLAQFHAKKLTQAGVADVVHSLQASAEEPVAEDRVKSLFEGLWPQFEKLLADIPDQAPTERHARPQHEVMEELVAGVRALDSRLREFEEGVTEPRFRRNSRGIRHPMMLRELQHHLADGPEDPIGLLVLASGFRDDAPWLYELTLEAYHAVNSHRKDAPRLLDRLRRAVEVTMHGPMMEETFQDPRMIDTFMSELAHFAERLPEGRRSVDRDGTS